MSHDLERLEKQLEGITFVAEGGRALYYYMNYLIMRSYYIEHPTWKLNKFTKGACIILKNHKGRWYFAVDDERDFLDALAEYLQDPERIKKLEVYIEGVKNQALTVLITDPAKLSDEELAKCFTDYFENMKLIVKAASTVRCIDRGILVSARQDFPADKVDETVRLMATNVRPSTAVREEIELLKLAEDAKVGKINAQKIEHELQKIHSVYGPYVMGYYNEKPKSLDFYSKKLYELIDQDPSILLKTLEFKIEKEKEEWRLSIQTLPEKYQLIAGIASASSFLKDFYKSNVNQIEYVAEPFFIELAKRCSAEVEAIKDLSPDEIITLTKGGSVDFTAAQKRAELCLTAYYQKGFYEIAGEEAALFEEKYLTHTHSDLREFKGRVACTGYAKGKAVVVTNPKDFAKTQNGDILVVVNTSPDFIPIIHKASGIVSEEGGLTAHVSVISREYNKPCVVGIRGITDIIKDGDIVEVDAEKGVVRILS